MFIAVDIDGTLADGSHKAHLLKHAKPGETWPEQDWEPWIAACLDDKVIPVVLETVDAFIEAGHYIELWTGRGEHAREVTEAWLDRHGLGQLPLRMRKMTTHEETHEPDHVTKARFIDRYGRPDLIIEDRQSVVDMWREMGIPVFQVAKGDY